MRDMDGQLLDIHAVAQRLGVGERHIRRLVFERRIPYIKWGHLIRFDPADIDRWLEESRRPAVAPSSYAEVTSPVRSDRAHQPQARRNGMTPARKPTGRSAR